MIAAVIALVLTLHTPVKAPPPILLFQTNIGTVEAGKSWTLAFDHQMTVPAGLALQYSVRDGSTTLPTVFTRVGTTSTLSGVMPAPTAGVKNMTLAVKFNITDTAAWRCATSQTDTSVTAPFPVQCAEVATAFSVTAVTPTPPVPQPPTPSNIRIILTPAVASNSNKVIGVNVSLQDESGATFFTDFIPVANVTGRTDLLSTAIISTVR